MGGSMTHKQRYAIQRQNEKRIIDLCGKSGAIAPETSGIYIFVRKCENGFKYAYVGQAKNLLQRMASHLTGYQHIDISIKKHGLFDPAKNPTGWAVQMTVECDISQLDALEQHYIALCAQTHQLRNKTTGSQGEGKSSISDQPRKGYLQGKADGEAKVTKKISEQIVKYTTGLTSKGGAIADRKTAELNEIIKENST